MLNWCLDGQANVNLLVIEGHMLNIQDICW